MKTKILLVIVLFGWTMQIQSQQLAFPGAEGYGKHVTGGRGGRVVYVTNLLDQNFRTMATEPGSFRAALNTTGSDPITIVFKVSGTIKLSSAYIKTSRSNMTIAGQTAPGDGICIRYGGVTFSGSNIIIRNIRFRNGNESNSNEPSLTLVNAKNIIVDHCSMSWSIEEVNNVTDTKNVTIQWCIISEGLYNAGHIKGQRSYGSQWGGQYTSYHHNIMANCNSRSPRMNGACSNDTFALTDVRNNIISNWGGGGVYGGEVRMIVPNADTSQNLARCMTNFINNYYKRGPAGGGASFASPSEQLALVMNKKSNNTNITGNFGEWFFKGNYMLGQTTINTNNWAGVSGLPSTFQSANEFVVSPIVTQTAEEAYTLVLAGAGAIKPKRDAVDKRIVGQIKGDSIFRGGASYGAGSNIIDNPLEVGGWPTLGQAPVDSIPLDTDLDGMPNKWETANGLNPNDVKDGPIITADGYSNLEHYLNSEIPYLKPLVTSISQATFESYTVYPNPAKDKIFFDLNESVKMIEIFDLSGKQIISVKNPLTNSISISNLNEGIYIVKTTFIQGIKVFHKIIKR